MKRAKPPPIDNNPTPSYLSRKPGWFKHFASIPPEKCRIPERRKLKSGRGSVLQTPAFCSGALL